MFAYVRCWRESSTLNDFRRVFLSQLESNCREAIFIAVSGEDLISHAVMGLAPRNRLDGVGQRQANTPELGLDLLW